jgi:hypothetical protein
MNQIVGTYLLQAFLLVLSILIALALLHAIKGKCEKMYKDYLEVADLEPIDEVPLHTEVAEEEATQDENHINDT